MNAQEFTEIIDDYIERKVRSIIIQLNLVTINESRKLAILDLEIAAKDKLQRALEYITYHD